MFWIIASTVVATCMAVLMIFVRLKMAKKPTTVKKIILPPIFMSTGAFMFLFPEFHLTIEEVLEALILGGVFSIFLIKTSKFEIKGSDIYLIPSKSFIFILIGLLVVRMGIKVIIGSQISLGATSGMFFLLAFAMIVSWRLAMLRKFKKVERELKHRMLLR
ncbi:cytochrome c biogenesis protein CcdC [Virgibacillus soli]|uniref:Cytochrome c biogenesis protein CcdC n=1 Tax=Paracerasibacillus soli TaxID=480284 RepID=A0ABU5CPF2_9BACI|nr:cytochrome c biogenesis protein CcdC [Virgibacillus soli]MDY0408232.1 cytochrome c biogenesis protein CcdC [Virgibacillus soli]